MDATRLETEPEHANPLETAAIGNGGEAATTELTPPKSAIVGDAQESRAGIDPIEEALATALERASAAQQWDVVALLAKELEARRKARMADNVVRLCREKK